MEQIQAENTVEKCTVSLSIVEPKVYEPVSSQEVLSNSKGMVKWGSANDYPEYLYDIYNSCATLQSIINGTADFVMGNGIIDNTNFEWPNEHGDSLEDVVHKIVYDRLIFGGCALQVKYSALTGLPISVAYIDFRKVRTNESGSEVYVHDKWKGSWGSRASKKFHAFDPATGKDDGVQIYYYKGKKTRGVYPVCEYNAAIVSCMIQIGVQVFHYEELRNNFTGTTIISFNNGLPTAEVKAEIERKLNQKYSGADNAGRILISWSNGADNAPTVQRLQPDNLDTRYKDVEESSRENIFIAWRAHPQLFGLPVSSGFTDVNYDDTFKLYMRTLVSPIEKEIERIFADIKQAKGAMKIIPFSSDLTDDSAD